MFVKVRKYQKKDIEAVEKITKETFGRLSWAVDRNLPEKPLPAEVSWRLWGEDFFASPHPKCLVAEHEGRVIGFEIYGYSARYSEIFGLKFAYLGLLAVASQSQGMGVGSTLVRTVIRMLKQDDVDVVTVTTDLDNLPAIACYEKQGMRVIHSVGSFRHYPRFGYPKVPELNDIRIYEATESDFPRLKGVLDAIRRQTSLHADNRLPREGLFKLDVEIAQSVLKDIVEGRLKVIVAEEGGEFIGCVTGAENAKLTKIYGAPWSLIQDLTVIPSRRGKGVGTAILGHALEVWSKGRKALLTEVKVPLNNWAMINAVTKAGFRLAHCSVTLHGIPTRIIGREGIK